MASGQPRGQARRLAEPGRPACEQTARAVDGRMHQRVGLLLAPVQRAGAAEDAQAQVVLATHGDLRGHEHAARPALEAQQQAGVVVELASRHEGAEVGAQALELQTGDGGDQVLGMRADVAQCAGRATAGRVGAPAGLLVVAALELGGQPALVVLDHHLAHLADRAGGHQRARLAHHRVAAVVVGHAEHAAAALDGAQQVLGLFAGVDQRLVAHDVDARLGEGLGHRMVQVVGRDDGDEVDALVDASREFVVEQRLPVGVVAIVR